MSKNQASEPLNNDQLLELLKLSIARAQEERRKKQSEMRERLLRARKEVE